MAEHIQDKYANLASLALTMSAADTETFGELLTGISLGQGRGMLIDQIDYYFDQGTIALMVGVGDEMLVGWTSSAQASALGFARRTTIHAMNLNQGPVIGTPASAGGLVRQPFIHQFNPPIVVAAPRLFLAAASASLGTAGIVSSRIYFRYITLTALEYLELAETFVLVG